jgi:hypothetical protein
MILSALALSAALSMPNFALWIEVRNSKTKEVKHYHTALNFKPDKGDTIFTIPLHGTKKKIPIKHLGFSNYKSGDASWRWQLTILNKPYVVVGKACYYRSSRGHKPDTEAETFQYEDHSIVVRCFDPKK